MFHRHQWEVVGEKYSPRDPRLTNFKGTTDAETYLQVVYGITVLTQRCAGCGRVDVTRVTGQTNGAV